MNHAPVPSGFDLTLDLAHRPRRNRKSEWARRLVAKTC